MTKGKNKNTTLLESLDKDDQYHKEQGKVCYVCGWGYKEARKEKCLGWCNPGRGSPPRKRHSRWALEEKQNFNADEVDLK